jgi:hypothetical protein
MRHILFEEIAKKVEPDSALFASSINAILGVVVMKRQFFHSANLMFRVWIMCGIARRTGIPRHSNAPIRKTSIDMPD